ncbi:hypothetical protein GCM10027565_26770 [Bordetella tumulicola]
MSVIRSRGGLGNPAGLSGFKVWVRVFSRRCTSTTVTSERKMMDCLNRLGYDIGIKVRSANEPLGHLTLAFA